MSLCKLLCFLFNFSSHFLLVFFKFCRKAGISQSQNLDGEDSCVSGTGFPDCHGGYRNTGRHLDSGQQRIHSLQTGRIDRNPDDRQAAMGRHGAGQMGGMPGAGNDYFNAALTRRRCPVCGPLRAAVSGGNRYFESNAKIL